MMMNILCFFLRPSILRSSGRQRSPTIARIHLELTHVSRIVCNTHPLKRKNDEIPYHMWYQCRTSPRHTVGIPLIDPLHDGPRILGKRSNFPRTQPRPGGCRGSM